MCGIFAVINDHQNQAVKKVYFGLKNLEYRGYDSWGLVVKKVNGSLKLIKKVGKMPDKEPDFFSSLTALGHTRWATHGGISKKNAHPHFDCQKKIFVVHNGIIENFNELKNLLLKKGHQFSSETDSEVVAHLVEDVYSKFSKNNPQKNSRLIFNIFKKISGLNALVIFLPEYDQLLAVKNSSPLIFGFDKKNNQRIIASDYSAMLPYLNHFYFLEDNEVLFIDKKNYWLFVEGEKKKQIKLVKIKEKPEIINLGKYQHFMIKEVFEQPQIIENIIREKKESIIKLAKIIKESYGNYLIGCGTAYHACLAATYLFSLIAKRHTNAALASEFSYLADFLTKKSLVIALSQSGETIDVISSIKAVKQKKAKTLAITNVLGSTVYRLADYQLLLEAGPEKSVLATKSFTAKLSVIYLLAYSLNSGLSKGVSDLKKAIEEIKKIFKNQEKIKKIAKRLKDEPHIFTLGRGVSYPIALEAALKIKESSYIHAEGLAAGELKHGTIALIEKGTPVLVFNPEDETYEDTLSSAFEVKARGAYLIGFSSKKNAVYDQFIEINNCSYASIIPMIVAIHLLAYYLTLKKGFDPDKPRNLAKSVTVK